MDRIGEQVARDDADFQEAMLRYLDRAQAVNAFTIGRRTDLFEAACLLLVIQVALWSAVLAW